MIERSIALRPTGRLRAPSVYEQEEAPGQGVVDAVLFAIFLALPALLAQAVPAASQAFEFDRGALAAGQLWRLLTCHWTHWSGHHLLWDVGVLVFLAALSVREDRRRTQLALAAAAVLIPLAVWAWEPGIGRYRGLSGLDAALLALVAGSKIRRFRDPNERWPAVIAALVLAGFLGKVVFELATGRTFFVDSAGAGFVPVPLAHLIGALCGLAAAAWGNRRTGWVRMGPSEAQSSESSIARSRRGQSPNRLAPRSGPAVKPPGSAQRSGKPPRRFRPRRRYWTVADGHTTDACRRR